MNELHRIVGPKSVCGAIVSGDRIVEIAPYMHKAARAARWSWTRFVERLWHGFTTERVS